MPDMLSKEDRLELSMWQARVETAEVRLAATREQYNAAAQRVTDAYGITPADRINLETGEIARGKPAAPPADQPAPPA
jgi:hypothetical protein